MTRTLLIFLAVALLSVGNGSIPLNGAILSNHFSEPGGTNSSALEPGEKLLPAKRGVDHPADQSLHPQQDAEPVLNPVPDPAATEGEAERCHRSVFPWGISVEYGLGKYAVRDEYISKSKYSGRLPYFRAAWSRVHDHHAYSLSLEYQNSSSIKNNKVSTDIHQFALGQSYLYPLPRMSLFSRDLFGYLGPSSELYFFYNSQDVALSGIDDDWESVAGLLSLGIHSEFILPLRNNLQVEASTRLSIVSVGLRSVDDEEQGESEIKLLTLLSGLNATNGLGVRYYLFENVSLRASYRFQLTKISAWDSLLASGDHVNLMFTYGW